MISRRVPRRFVAVVIAFAVIGFAFAQRQAVNTDTVVYIVRHCEKGTGSDPGLTQVGQKRAELLGKTLRSANLSTIYATQYRRTQETAQPTARILKEKLTKVSTNETEKLAKMLKTKHRGEAVLVVGHSFTLPDLFRSLGVRQRISFNVSTDYDSLFIVTLDSGGSLRNLLQLHYGTDLARR